MKPVVIKPRKGVSLDTAFDVIRPDLFALAQDGVAPFQFAVLPLIGRIDDLSAVLDDLTRSQLDAAQSGRLGLVFDNSLEAMAQFDQRMDRWHAVLDSRGIPADHCVVLNQARGFAPAYDAYCDRAGRVRCLTALPYDYFVKRFALFHGDDGAAVFERRLARFHQRLRSRRPFLAMNYKPRPHRFALLVRLVRHGLLDKGLVSFSSLDRDRTIGETVPWRRASPLDGITESWPAAGYERELDQILALGTRSLPDDRLKILPSGIAMDSSLIADADLPYFDETFFSAVTETEMVHVRHRVTEKPLKPLANFHPFVMFGNFQALDILRGFGFRTFEPLIDERYDAIAAPEARFEMAFAQVLRLCRLAEAGTLDLDGVHDTLIHNAEFALTRFAASYTEQYDRPVIDAMMRIANTALERARVL